MDYITKKIGDKSNLFQFNGDHREAATQEQSRLEYLLILILSYLWNKNIDKIDKDIRDRCIREIDRPSIGSILEISRSLDIDNESFGNNRFKKFRETINSYPKIRNEKIGHGFSFEDDSVELYKKFIDLYDTLTKSPPDFLKGDIDIVKVMSSDEKNYKAIIYKATGDYAPVTIPKQKVELQVNSTYIKSKNSYSKISPFIVISGIDEFYIYSYTEDKLAARALFNRLLTTERRYFDVPEITSASIEDYDSRRRSANGTIVNNYVNNYKKYIDTSIVKKLLAFLKNNKSTVFATLWGHGGVGKTAAIQRVCETLLQGQHKHFDYIVFASAKDRYYNYYTGEIEQIDSSADSLDAIIRFINKTIFNQESANDEEIINFQGHSLIVLDDYETFSTEEKIKIIEFIKKLNISHHKVVITTRSASHITGEEIQVEELTSKETLEFFDSVIENELNIDPSQYRRLLDLADFEKKLHELTSGRPLFIFQAAMVYGESGSISESIKINLGTQETAMQFLYGRIFNYLSTDAKKVFSAIGLLITEADLTNVLSKLRYILNMESDTLRFELAIEELTKLKIIKITDSKFFKVYSSEIASMMHQSFKDEGDAGGIKHRLLLIGSDKKLDTDLSLLDDADNSRVSRRLTDVINKYRHIISRQATPENIKIKAIINLAKYLIDDEGDFEQGIATLEEFHHRYSSNPHFVKIYAAYMWRGDEAEKYKAIDAVRTVINSRILDDNSSEKYIFLSTLMSYETSLLTQQREDIKSALNLDEISKENYKKIFSEQRDSFFRIYKHPGELILKTVRDDTLKDFDNETKLSCLSGLSSLLEVCLRRQMYEEIDEILKYTFNNLKYNYHDGLKRKLERINRVRSSDLKHYDDYITPGSIGDRFNSIPAKPKLSLKPTGSLGIALLSAMKDEEPAE